MVSINLNKNFGLSTVEFDDLVNELRHDNNELFEKIFLSHFGDSMTFLKRNYKSTHDDAYDAVMDTMIEFRQRIIEGKIYYGNLRYLFTKMATQKYMRQANSYKSRPIVESDITTVNHIEYNEEDIKTLAISWEYLGEECQTLLKLHIHANMKLVEIAEQMDRSPATIRKKKERCIKKLMQIFKKHNKTE